MQVVVQEMRLEDSGEVAELCGELGYPISPPDMAKRIHAQLQLHDHVTYVACLDDRVVGWIDVGITHHLQAEPYGEIGGFVVSSTVRGKGIGKQLLAAAERWAAERGLRHVLVRSQAARDRAHEFYLREGYKQTKISAVFTKVITAE